MGIVGDNYDVAIGFLEKPLLTFVLIILKQARKLDGFISIITKWA